MMRKIVLVLYTALFWACALDTDLFALIPAETKLDSCLVVQFPRISAREMQTLDPVELQMVLGTWVPPEAGDTMIVAPNDSIPWRSLAANEEGWFSDRALRGGYAYFCYEAEQSQVLLLEGMGHNMVYVNGQPRAGNRYQTKETFESWEPRFDYSLLPVFIHEGENELLFQCSRGRLKVVLHEPASVALFNGNDLTVPDLIIGETVNVWGSLVVINAGPDPLSGLFLTVIDEEGNVTQNRLPRLQPLSLRKVPFALRGPAPAQKGVRAFELKLLQQLVDEYIELDAISVALRVVGKDQTYRRTFISDIDGSVQYYAVNPASASDDSTPKALFLSTHGAGVLAFNQANSYYPKSWGHVVAPTNRRPYGFNWEDWGRMDALEVLDIARKSLNIDPQRVYLTGHSMGGHGAWHLGVTYPDKFAAIGPSAGWISFWSYRVRERMEGGTEMDEMLMRATAPSNTEALANNYARQGVYILHGSEDTSVRPEQSRTMAELLETFHHDFVYHEQEGAGHWWDDSEEPGTDCVDWAPMFDFFARHTIPGKQRVRQVDFITANPGVSSKCDWISIEAQHEQLKNSSVSVRYDPGLRRFVGNTENVARLALDFSFIPPGDAVTVALDGMSPLRVEKPDYAQTVLLNHVSGYWFVIDPPPPLMKNPKRYGTFKDVFKNDVLFVYGTAGDVEENDWAFCKARFDAEQFWYQGNGSVEVIADEEYNPAAHMTRNIVLYGNAGTNTAWESLLGASPVQVTKGAIFFGARKIKGDDLACLFIRPRFSSSSSCVAAVAGTGIVGMRLADRRPYLSPGYAYPDLMVFTPELLTSRRGGYVVAGFFGLDWSITTGEFVWKR